jgi:hypothetical protein
MDMNTLQDAINAWNKVDDERKAEEEAEQLRRLKDAEEFVKKAFEKIELEPDVIAGWSAFLTHEGKTYEFQLSKGKYNFVGFRIVLPESCPRCKEPLLTSMLDLTLENIGFALTRQEKDYHDCPEFDYSPTQTQPQTTREKMLDAIDSYISEVVSAITA